MLYKNNYVNSKILVKSYIRRKLRIKRMYSTMQKSNEPRAAAAAAAIPEENKKRLVLSDSGANMYRQVEDKLGHLKQDDILPKCPPLIIVVTGSSGAGKDTVIQQLLKKRNNLHFVVTATSRPPRENEKDGIDYHFVSKETFEKWISEGKLIEHALVYGDYKGIPREEITSALAKGEDVIMRVNFEGANTVKKLFPESISLFITGKSEADVTKQLISRSTDEIKNIITRVETAREEVLKIPFYDYAVMNEYGKLEETVEKVMAIIEAEKSRTSRLFVTGETHPKEK